MDKTNKQTLGEKMSDIANRKFMWRGEKYHLGETAAAYTLLIPTLITLIVLFVLPLVMLIVLSFTDYRMTTGQMDFNGIDNYIYLFTSDKFWQAMRNTVFFAVIKLGLDVCLALAVALALDSNIYCRKVLRTVFFSPVVTPVVACSLIWLWFYDPGIGPFNQILGWFGIEPLKWIFAKETAMMSIIIFSVWHGLGYNVMLLLSGLQGISGEYLEAAKLDGATDMQIIWKIKLPLLKPIISFVLMMGIINAFKAFSEVNVMTPDGGPGYSTAMAVNYIYEQAFTNGRMGRGAAASILLFIVIFVLTQLKNKVGGSKEIDT
ncbi:MAG: sugar ABC transporter permease [Oscillibacter sp.]|nr:sugar ABC transporter permease [Oscillibacter sp.]MBQ2996018.1 sugar ABC transporter permease [Oscillibacter sp.]